MTDDVRDGVRDDADKTRTDAERAHDEKHEADRRRDGRRVTERKGESVRAAIREELSAKETPPASRRALEQVERESATPIIELENVYLAFATPILEDVSFAARKGETICIVGESGTGKSTTLKLILRLLVPDKGCVNIDGEDITHLTFEEALAVRQRMGMVFQGAALFDSMTVYENVAYPLREHTDYDEAEIERRVREKLSFVDLDPDVVMELLPSSLSGGMRKRVGIARAMANDPCVMLYDEPTSGLDPLTTATITRLIIKLQRELNVTSIVVSHDIRSSFKMATKIALLADCTIKFFGTPEELQGTEDRYIRDFLGGY
jgi:phospholipid/cholesterol/gamma-HCH transport system ATP-binding protein